jgi:hypothetical protein
MISDSDVSEISVSFDTRDTRRNKCRDEAVGIVTRYGLNDGQGQDIFLTQPAPGAKVAGRKTQQRAYNSIILSDVGNPWNCEHN